MKTFVICMNECPQEKKLDGCLQETQPKLCDAEEEHLVAKSAKGWEGETVHGDCNYGRTWM